MFKTFMQAGFECGQPFPHHDLLYSSEHTPKQKMREHYKIIKDHGILTVRDGLPENHNMIDRVKIANEEKMEVLFDVQHYWIINDVKSYAMRIVDSWRKVCQNETLWICNNEPMIEGLFLHGKTWQDSVSIGLEIINILKSELKNVKVLTTDPINGAGEWEYEATDAFVSAGIVDVVGVNYYPHTMVTDLNKVLKQTEARYNLPLMVAETSWHDGHPVHEQRFPTFSKVDWIEYILNQTKDVDVRGVCWYPIVSTKPWEVPNADYFWHHGLSTDGQLDADLSRWFKEHN